MLSEEIKLLNGEAGSVFVGGFSMGCAIAIKAFLTLPKDDGILGGVFVSSGILAAEIDWASLDLIRKKMTPIAICHGEDD